VKFSAAHDRGPAAHAYSETVKRTYAVKWREPDGQTYLGRLTLGPRTIRLEGREPDGPAVDRQIGYEEVRNLRVGSSGPSRLDGRPTLVVERADGQYLLASAGMGAGIVQELVERIAGLRLVGPRRAILVAPLKEGAGDRVRELAGHGPPFAPADTALTRHQLLLTDQEAIFVFEAQTEEGLKAVLNQVDIWAAAVTWQDLVDGPPRLAEVAYAWERPEPRVVPAIGLGL
jgi:hypothetical protein